MNNPLSIVPQLCFCTSNNTNQRKTPKSRPKDLDSSRRRKSKEEEQEEQQEWQFAGVKTSKGPLRRAGGDPLAQAFCGFCLKENTYI